MVHREPQSVRATTAVALSLVAALAGGLAVGVAQVYAAPSSGPQAVAADSGASSTQPLAAGALAGSQAIIDVYHDVAPAVVAIEVSGTLPATSAIGQGSRLSYRFQAAGSGVIVDPNGLILTNRHVVGDASDVTVLLSDGRQLAGTVKGLDTLTDLALVSVDATGLPTATLGDSSTIQVGELAIAMGNPDGDLPGSVTAGIVSAMEREIVAGDQSGLNGSELLRHLIQHDAAINPGNSGGPLLDGSGAVIGINTAIAGDAQGIGFAIPIDLAKPIIDQVEAGRPIERPYIGVFYTDIDSQLMSKDGLSVSAGALIGSDTQAGQAGVIAGGPADQAGLQDGDIVTALDDEPIDAAHQLDLLLLQHEPGDTVTLTTQRGDTVLHPELTLGTRPADIVQ